MGIKTKKTRYNKRGGKRAKNKTKKRKQDKQYKQDKHKQDKDKDKQFKKLNCSPENKEKEYTCYSDSDLNKLKEIWNIRHPDQPIKTSNPKQIWETLKEYYASVCNKETCWVRQMTKNTKMEQELLDAFAPESPAEWNKNPNEWLSSIDILKVMNQYEKKYKCFDFIGPSPIDYDTHKLYGECVWEELCHFNLKEQIKKGHTKIGVIFNLDPHYKGGSHWVSLFINIKNKTIFYFDSAGEAIPEQIKKFVDSVIVQGHKLSSPINFKFDQNNPVEHQYGNTECGVYSIFFIIHMLEDKITGHYLKTHMLKDEYMQQFRNIFYNKNGDV
jgi:hypothetical protein